MKPGRLAAAGLASPARATPEGIAGGEKSGEVVESASAALPLKHTQVVVLVAVNGLSDQLAGYPVNYAISTTSS